MRSHLRTVAGLVLAAAFLWLAFGRVDWSSIGTVLSEATPGPLVLGVLALAAGFFVRIVRWWTMLRALEPAVSLRSCVRPFLLSLAVNNTMPLRAGDVVRAVGFRDALRSPVMRVVGTLLIERVLDLFVLVALFFVGLLAVPAGVVPRAFVVSTALLGGVALIALLVLVLSPGVLRVAADRATSSRMLEHRAWTPRVREPAHRLADTFALARSPARAMQLLSLSVLAWLLEGTMYACVAWALHVGGSPVAPWFTAATGTLATLIPSSPGYVGTFDYFAILGLTAFGAHRAAATALAVVVHVVLWLPVTIVGAAFLVKPRFPRMVGRPERQRANA